jgi:transcriptional regulator with XRE-family HTH domain
MGGQKIRDNSVMIKFGVQLRRLRKTKNFTQEELSFKAGISTSQIARIETGKLNTTISTVISIAKALQINPCVFFEDM